MKRTNESPRAASGVYGTRLGATMRNKIMLAAFASAVLLMAASPFANATTITFAEVPPGDDNVAITNIYTPLGVTFAGNNSGTWEGLSAGDIGNWGLQST
jgi:hypothetical protein